MQGFTFFLKKKTGEIWPSMKDVGIAVSVKTYLIYFRKKYTTYLRQKALQKNKLTNGK